MQRELYLTYWVRSHLNFKKPIFDKEYKKIIHHGKDREYKEEDLGEIMWEDVGHFIRNQKGGLLKAKNIILCEIEVLGYRGLD